MKADDKIAKVCNQLIPYYLPSNTTRYKYAIRARNGWADAEKAQRPRVDILTRLDEVARKTPQDGLSD